MIDQYNAIVLTKPKMVIRILEALMAHEKTRFETCLNADLTRVGIEFSERTKGNTR